MNDKYRQMSRQAVSKIRQRLVRLLPSYMVPTAWAVLEKVPITTTGKINRTQVSRWIEDMTEVTYSEVADLAPLVDSGIPATEMESKLQCTWSEVLNVPLAQVRLNRSFIELGGDSITSMQVVTRCRTKNIQITIQDILYSKGITEAASRATLSDQENSLVYLLPSQRVATLAGYNLSKIGVSALKEIEDVYACSPVQEGILLGQIKVPGAYENRFF